jgi:hypothetical protein
MLAARRSQKIRDLVKRIELNRASVDAEMMAMILAGLAVALCARLDRAGDDLLNSRDGHRIVRS